MRADLTRARRDTGSASSMRPATLAVQPPAPASAKRWIAIAAAAAFAIVVIALIGFAVSRSRDESPSDSAKSSAPIPIAVLPFQNLSGNADADFLRMALPDEVATTLTSMRGLSIRPFATTAKYAKADVDLQQAAKELRVGRVVTGHYQKVGKDLQLTLEAVDVADDRVLWTKTLNAPSEDLVAMRDLVTSNVLSGLIPALGVVSVNEDSGTRPKNEEAYDLYLRSVAIAHDGAQKHYRYPLAACSNAASASIPHSHPHGLPWEFATTTTRNTAAATIPRRRAPTPHYAARSR